MSIPWLVKVAILVSIDCVDVVLPNRSIFIDVANSRDGLDLFLLMIETKIFRQLDYTSDRCRVVMLLFRRHVHVLHHHDAVLLHN